LMKQKKSEEQVVIKSITLKNFQLFKDQTINLARINLIAGLNYDSLEENGIYSSNGSGKSTILNAILFGLFGEVTEVNLKDLIRIGTKEAEVSVVLSHNNQNIIISRKIPSALSIREDGKLLQFNTATIAQKYLNDLFGSDFLHYRTYNLIDNKKGINLLDLGITPLRKSLMDFVNAQFITIRQSLLAKKLERETYNVNKRLYTFHLSTKRQTLLETGLLTLQEELSSAKKDYEDQYKEIEKYSSLIDSKEKIIYYKNQELKKAEEGICPILKKSCDRIGNKLTDKDKLESQTEIKDLNHDISVAKKFRELEGSYLSICNGQYESIQKRVQKTKEYLMKLKEAQKFSAYKYTQTDVQLYSDSIKTLDAFASYYIISYLDNLKIIINDLLQSLNISIDFSINKDFLTINNNEQDLKYEMLSSGQRAWLGIIFKLGILLNEGITTGLVLCDEGMNTLDNVNFQKLLTIIKTLNFQFVIIKQDSVKSDEINQIRVIRENNESKIDY